MDVYYYWTEYKFTRYEHTHSVYIFVQIEPFSIQFCCCCYDVSYYDVMVFYLFIFFSSLLFHHHHHHDTIRKLIFLLLISRLFFGVNKWNFQSCFGLFVSPSTHYQLLRLNKFFYFKIFKIINFIEIKINYSYFLFSFFFLQENSFYLYILDSRHTHAYRSIESKISRICRLFSILNTHTQREKMNEIEIDLYVFFFLFLVVLTLFFLSSSSNDLLNIESNFFSSYSLPICVAFFR